VEPGRCLGRVDTTYTGHYYSYSDGVNGFIGSTRDDHNLTDNSTPLFEDVGTVAGTYGAQAIRSISLRPRTLGFQITYRH
jgi:hypothetical protein